MLVDCRKRTGSIRTGDKEKIVDGSYLMLDAEESRGTVSEDELLKGKHLMDGESAISKSGRGRIYAYGATTADHDVII